MSAPTSISHLSDDAFREIFQSMSEGLIMVDEDGKILVANPVAEQIFGYAKGELTGRTMEDLLPLKYRSGHIQYRSQFNANPAPRKMGTERELTALRKDGKEFPVEVSLSYTRYRQKVFVMAFISDITQRKNVQDALKRSEEQLIVYAAELEKKVEMRTEALNSTVEKLENEIVVRRRAEEETKKALAKERELNDLKSKFVSLASHEFRTPLSSVMSSASLIAQYKDRGELDKVDKHVNRIKSSVSHLTNILNDFLSLGKLEEGKIEISVEWVNLESFLLEIEEELRNTLRPGQRILVQCDPNTPRIQTDTRILRNVLFNLLSNASKYSNEGKEIVVRSRSSRDEVILDVVDQGIGIPKEDSKHVFERFFRATNSGNVQGTGLGLNIVKRYAELLGGSVSFTSDYGKGSTFSITLPTKDEKNSVD
jgi:PAS domain S-box-containing protein